MSQRQNSTDTDSTTPQPTYIDDTTATDDNKDAAKGPKKNPNVNRSKRGRKKGIIETEPPIGTRDFLPADMRLRNWLFGHWSEVARLFAFQVSSHTTRIDVFPGSDF